MSRTMSGAFAAYGKEERKRGKTEGFVIGKAEGIAIGKTEGIAIGEEQTKRAFVRSMLADGFAPEVIAKHSALPLSEVQALAQQREQAGGHS